MTPDTPVAMAGALCPAFIPAATPVAAGAARHGGGARLDGRRCNVALPVTGQRAAVAARRRSPPGAATRAARMAAGGSDGDGPAPAGEASTTQTVEVLGDAPPPSPKPAYSQATRLREETEAPFRKARMFVFGASAASAGVGSLVAASRVVAAAVGVRGVQPLDETLPNVRFGVGVETRWGRHVGGRRRGRLKPNFATRWALSATRSRARHLRPTNPAAVASPDGAVWLCVALCGSVWRCVWRCVALCGSVWRRVAPCASDASAATLCVARRRLAGTLTTSCFFFCARLCVCAHLFCLLLFLDALPASPWPRAGDWSATPQLAINFGVLLTCAFLLRQEVRTGERRMSRLARGASLARLKVTVPPKEVITKLGGLRSKRRLVILAGREPILTAAVASAEQFKGALYDRRILVVPLLLPPAGGTAEAEVTFPTGNWIATPVLASEWLEWFAEEKVAAKVDEARAADEVLVVIVKFNGKVGGRSMGMPAWSQLVGDIDAIADGEGPPTRTPATKPAGGDTDESA